MNDQRWLSIDGICTELQMTRQNVLWLAKQGFISVIWGRNGAKNAEARFLSPTSAYASKLKLAEALYGRLYPIPIDLDMAPLLSLREVAEILGIDLRVARRMQAKKRIPNPIKVGKYHLYSTATVRELLWKRQGRKTNKQRDPFLLEDLIRFFVAHQDEEAKHVPTDEAFAKDAELQKKFSIVMKMKSPERDKALLGLWEKIDLAKSVASAITDAKTRACS